MDYEFEPFQKIPRLNRDICVTEKIDGTNAQILIEQDGTFLVGSRRRWIIPGDDNFGFAAWAQDRKDDLIEALGPGRHFGEWWGSKIQRGYDIGEKRFSLFNTSLWNTDNPPAHCSVVPTLYEGLFDMNAIRNCVEGLRCYGSRAALGFMSPEGVVIYHSQGNIYFKITLVGDGKPKSLEV